ncbi:MAG TPA: PfkB family carbohydrate kinase, partial [Mycobacteriales bacterium]|nr:PfkB family carbohydrate kinase [Mycobacteriales bacterium]
MENLLTLAERFGDLRVLVVGEAFLDEWLSGPSHRLSREAPVPIVAVDDRQTAPGAAANTAANAVALGARTRFLSVLGDDEDGWKLVAALRARAVPDDDVLVEPGRRTVAKRRVLAAGQMLTRFDEGDVRPLAKGCEDELLDRLRSLAATADVVVLSDYAAGLFTDRVRDGLAEMLAALGVPTVVDARNLLRWAPVRPTAVTPNFDETLPLLGGAGLDTTGPRRAEVVQTDGERVLEAAGCALAVVTLDVDGAVLLERRRPPYRVYTTPAAQTRAAGAGDTFTAAFALALAAGADGPGAVEVGSAAASVVVRRPGTTVCPGEDLRDVLAHKGDAVLDLGSLTRRVWAHRAAGRSIVFTNGCFDVLHCGHVAYLNRAKQLGDVLVVGVNSDASVRRLKGVERPLNPVEDRAAVLAALSCVDHLVVFEGDTPADVLEAVRPDVYVKGGDYTPAMLPETPL